jgi:glutamate racemase
MVTAVSSRGRTRRAAPREGRQREPAIGIFDSGIGGLTVVKALSHLLPRETLIYLGDTARTPYGTKSAEVVRRYSLENAEFLIEKGVKLLVVACNTSSAVAIEALQQTYDLPVVGVIEPGAAAAAESTQNGKVGVIATEATIGSGSYTKALRLRRADLEIYTRACPLFVPLAEEGWLDNAVARATADLYLGSLRRSGIDTLILGCTHYPLLRDTIAEAMGPAVTLIDSATATAAVVRQALEDKGLARRRGAGATCFFVSDAPERFIKVGSRFLGAQVDSAVRIER